VLSVTLLHNNEAALPTLPTSCLLLPCVGNLAACAVLMLSALPLQHVTHHLQYCACLQLEILQAASAYASTAVACKINKMNIQPLSMF
jgi:hypothetical protein